MSGKAKIGALILMLGIITSLGFLSFSIQPETNDEIHVIEIEGNNHLSKDAYFKYAGFDHKENYTNLNSKIIKRRIEKHPYVNRADVVDESSGQILITIVENNFESILITNEKKYLLTDKLEVIPVMPLTQGLNYPIISHPGNNDEIKPFTKLNGNKSFNAALRILGSAKLVNPALYESISEIDLRNGKDIIAYFSDLPCPVIFGREDEVKKVIYLDELKKQITNNDMVYYWDYLDLRFDKHIYMGFPEENGAFTGENS